ncbi:DUF938 domain-containing protein [Sulfitobacter albidus]|uniref:DUF938 domain-containing protein n=1 Tax=Sulfitobacter albidus TaxID=2829501 RepID=A0A975JEF2_9RHOB|nr:DUF938 domain-containing protein [Sulfitobacter albidus]QUJ76827.1 DUF938 domain-containing protein [Sulfitobacter albidus]
MSLPPSASVAFGAQGAKLVAPAATRNVQVIVDLMQQITPPRGAALEIASGTGQHIVALAQALPEIDWQPSEVDADRLASIAAYADEAGLPNLRAPVRLDATRPGWAREREPFDMIHLVNLLHLISDEAAGVLISEAAEALRPGGTLMLYGPFKRDGVLTSQGDARFDAQLRGADPSIGYKDDAWLKERLTAADLSLTLVQDMPANNLAFVARKGSE